MHTGTNHGQCTRTFANSAHQLESILMQTRPVLKLIPTIASGPFFHVYYLSVHNINNILGILKDKFVVIKTANRIVGFYSIYIRVNEIR